MNDLAAIQQSGNATEANVTPLVHDVTGALSTAAGKLTDMLNPFAGLKRRQLDISSIISEITSVRSPYFFICLVCLLTDNN